MTTCACYTVRDVRIASMSQWWLQFKFTTMGGVDYGSWYWVELRTLRSQIGDMYPRLDLASFAMASLMESFGFRWLEYEFASRTATLRVASSESDIPCSFDCDLEQNSILVPYDWAQKVLYYAQNTIVSIDASGHAMLSNGDRAMFVEMPRFSMPRIGIAMPVQQIDLVTA